MPIQYAYTQLFFDQSLNVSIQVGDTAYYVRTQDSSVTTVPGVASTTFKINSNNIQEVGEVWNVYETSIVCRFLCNYNAGGSSPDCDIHIPNIGDFIMFSKDNAANMSSILGYYAEVEMVNDSNYKAKLFAVSTDISESSK